MLTDVDAESPIASVSGMVYIETLVPHLYTLTQLSPSHSAKALLNVSSSCSVVYVRVCICVFMFGYVRYSFRETLLMVIKLFRVSQRSTCVPESFSPFLQSVSQLEPSHTHFQAYFLGFMVSSCLIQICHYNFFQLSGS